MPHGARSVYLALVLAALASLACSSSAVAAPKRRKEQPSTAPADLPSNLPPERRPPPPSTVTGAAEGSSERSTGTSTSSDGNTRRRSLIPGLSNELALAGVGGVLLLLVLLLLVARRRRPAGARRPLSERVESEQQPAARTARKRDHSRLRHGGARAVQPPAGHEASTPSPQPSPEQSVLLARSDGAPSLYDTLLALGPDSQALRSLRQAAGHTLDALTWAGTVKDGRALRLASLTLAWSRGLALDRVAAWLRAHPLVTGGGLEVQVPGTLEPSDLPSLTLTRPDGLGVKLGGEQAALIEQARAALARAFSGQPFALLAASSALGALLPEESRSGVEQGHPPHALPLLLGGMAAHEWAARAGLSRSALDSEFCDALGEHAKLVGTPVPAEGPVIHALQVLGAGRAQGIGLLLAAVAGAAFSSSTVILRISKRIAETRQKPLLAVFTRLGALVCAVLDDESSADRGVILNNVRFILGEPLLEHEVKHAAVLLKDAERLAAREPLWKGSGTKLQNLDLALFSLHEMQVKLALERSLQARERLLDLIDRLAHPGSVDEEQTLGHRRLGYVLGGLGTSLLRNTSTELLSAGREAMAMASATAAASSPSQPRLRK